ncbi:hypothetical protein BRC81_07810 [Halobacteriales archaeon QS_1_68_20]|nr:MAG: hypothetical protein BRC81_07810 [Halobacteriales archaeon QS_1_68_20]
MNRRDVLQAASAGVVVALAGCLGSGESGPTAQQPDDCPVTQGLDVGWPEELTTETVESFVENYENAYYREKVVDFEQETRLDEYALSANVASGPTESGAGYEVELSGGGGVYRPNLHLAATVADAPVDADVHSTDDLETGLASLLRDAADSDEEVTQHVTRRDVVRRFVATVNELSDGEPLTGKGDAATLYFDVDGTTVELSVSASSFHGDYWWSAWYYVDENVVRRTDDDSVDPAEGELLECRGES